MRIFILGSYGPSLVNFRGDMIKAMIEQGHQVIACAPDDNGDIEEKIRDMGAKYVPINMRRTGMNPITDIVLIKEIKRILKNVEPDVFLSYTIKPNIFGTIAAHLAGVENIYGMMTGAGSVVRSSASKMKLLQTFLFPMYKFAFQKCRKVFFLNSDDMSLFIEKGIISKDKSFVIGSSGVNLELFKKQPLQNFDTFLFIARLIKDKGIFEFLEAAEIVKSKRPNIKFKILGPFDSNPTAISSNELKRYTDKGIVEYLGATDDVRPFIKNSYVIVLPSYHEGQGRVLIEAMAIGRSVLATDVPGCRQTVIDGETGYLTPPKDASALAEKVISMFDDSDLTFQMAEKGLKRAHEVFDVNKINRTIIEQMDLIK